MAPAVGDTISFYDEYSDTGAQVNQGVPIRFDFGDASQALAGDRSPTGIPPTPKCKVSGQLEYGMCLQGYVQEVDIAKNEMIVVSEIVHTFPNPGTFQASFQGCCRPDLIERNVQNNAGQPWKLPATVVALDSLPNQSPILALPPTVTAALGSPISFYVAAYNHDPVGETLTWAIGTVAEHDPLLGPSSGPPAGITVNAETGRVSFTAKFAEGVYSAVVLVQSVGQQQVARVGLDFYIQVVDGGGNTPPALLAPAPTAVIPTLCGEATALEVTLQDQESPQGDVTVSYESPQAVLYNAASRAWEAQDRPLLSVTASAELQWAAPCEVLGANVLYGYKGRHELDTTGVCFTVTDDGRTPQGFTTPLSSPPVCVFLRVLRCTRPGLQLRRAGGFASERRIAAGNGTQAAYTALVGSIVTWDFNASDDSQSLVLSVAADMQTGLTPGFEWTPPACESVPAPASWSPVSIPLTSCNPMSRQLTFTADVTHAGKSRELCVLAENDQTQCPDTLSFSPPICFTVDTPGPEIRFKAPTPAEDELLLTFLGCPLQVELLAEDSGRYFDMAISAEEGEFGLPDGAYLDPPTCAPSALPTPPGDTTGVLTCVEVQRRMVWRPELAQQGLEKRVCFSATTLTGHSATRCINLEVSKCRYCLQPGETLQAVAVSFATDWLQIFGANAHLRGLDTLSEFELINLGTLYPARAGDTLDGLRWRFKTSADSILRANPDITSTSQTLRDGQLVCVLPGSCTVTGPYPAR